MTFWGLTALPVSCVVGWFTLERVLDARVPSDWDDVAAVVASLLWLVLGIGTAGFIYAGVIRIRSCGPQRPDIEPRCAQCGYLLIGLSLARCPECGRAFDAGLLSRLPTCVGGSAAHQSSDAQRTPSLPPDGFAADDGDRVLLGLFTVSWALIVLPIGAMLGIARWEFASGNAFGEQWIVVAPLIMLVFGAGVVGLLLSAACWLFVRLRRSRRFPRK